MYILPTKHFTNKSYQPVLYLQCTMAETICTLQIASLYKYRSANTRRTTLAAAQFSSVTMNRSSAEQGSHGRKRKESLASEDRIWQTQDPILEMKSRNTKVKQQKHKQGKRILQLNKYWLLHWVLLMSWVEFTGVQFKFNLRSVGRQRQECRSAQEDRIEQTQLPVGRTSLDRAPDRVCSFLPIEKHMCVSCSVM